MAKKYVITWSTTVDAATDTGAEVTMEQAMDLANAQMSEGNIAADIEEVDE